MLDYDLLDSGDGEKLERFADKIIIRPCSTAIWKKKTEVWGKYNARFVPNQGWSFQGKTFTDWQIKHKNNFSMQLHLQTNGQIGVFPEHASYLNIIEEKIKEIKNNSQKAPKVLNLFAYTGLASLFCFKAGAEVVHVDKSKQVLTWAKENLDLNNINSGVRLIPEDALIFLKREEKRGHKYDLIIADPPNFSRINRNENWDLDKIIIQLVDAITKVLTTNGYLFITAHQSYAFVETVSNLLIDFSCQKIECLKLQSLSIKEKATKRLLPAGVIAYGKLQ